MSRRLVDGQFELPFRLAEPGSQLLVAGIDARSGQAQAEHQTDEPLLCAVVEVAFETAAFGIARLDDAGTRGTKIRLPGADVGLQTLVVEQQPGRRRDLGDEVGVVEHAAAVNDHRHRLAVTHERRDGPLAAIGRQRRPVPLTVTQRPSPIA